MNNTKVGSKGETWKSIAFLVSILLICWATYPIFQKAGEIIHQDSIKEGQQRMAQIPSYDREGLKVIRSMADSIIAHEDFFFRPPKDLSDYMDKEISINNIRLTLGKARDEQWASSMYYGPYGQFDIFLVDYPEKLEQALKEYQATYQHQWSLEDLKAERARTTMTRYDYSRLDKKPLTYSEGFYKYVVPLGGLVLLWYLLTGLIFNIYYFTVLRVLKNSWKEILWGRLFSGNLISDNLFWIAVFPRFPRGDSVELMRLAYSRVGTVLTFLVMQCSVAIVGIYAQKSVRVTQKDEFALIEEKPDREIPLLTKVLPKKSEVTPTPTPQKSNWKPEVTLTQSFATGVITPHGRKIESGLVSITNVKLQFAKLYANFSQSASLTKAFPNGSPANFAVINVGAEFPCGNLSCDVGGTYIANVPLNKSGGDVVVLYGSLSKRFQVAANQTVKFSAGTRYFVPVNGKTPKPGVMIDFSAQYSYKWKDWELKPSATIGLDNGIFGQSKAVLFKSNLQVNYKVNKHATLFANVDYSTPMNTVTDGKKPEMVSGGGMKYTW